MGRLGTLLGSAGAALLALCTGACSRPEPSPAPPPEPPPSAAVAPDRLEPFELAEGTEVAFGLKLPRGMLVRFRGPFEVQAEGHVQAELVANYIRKHMKADGVEVGAARTIFERARLRSDEKAPPCQIEVSTSGGQTRLVIRDLTPHLSDPTLSEEERWKQHGLDPNGRLIDPSRME